MISKEDPTPCEEAVVCLICDTTHLYYSYGKLQIEYGEVSPEAKGLSSKEIMEELREAEIRLKNYLKDHPKRKPLESYSEVLENV